MKLLVLTFDKYQDIELNSFIGTLNVSGKLDDVLYLSPDNLDNVFGANHIGSIKATPYSSCKNTIDFNDYDAIFIPGGQGCKPLRSNENAKEIVQAFIDLEKWIFAICDGPNVLCEWKMMLDKKYTSYPINNIENLSTQYRQGNELVFVDGKYITGRCPTASIPLAIKVLEVLYGKEVSIAAYNRVSGIK